MAKTWATFGADLHLDLTGTRPRAALERALRDAVQSGRLHPGSRLPSSRALATDLGVARNTVADAYGQLVAEGWLVALPGSGTRVADRVRPDPPGATPAPAVRPYRYSLVPGDPDLAAFPRAAWLAAARRAFAEAPTDAFGYGDPRGRPELRRALAEYLARARGVRTSADRIVVCSGFTQALGLLCRVLAARGARTVAVEDHGHRHHRDVLADRGLAVRPVPVDRHGAVVDGFGTAGAALLTPAHQFPLGSTLAPDRRNQAVDWADGRDSFLIEDDYDGEFRYDRQAVGAMQAMAPERVCYAGTASKTLAPALRLAWLALPAALVDEVVAARVLADHRGPVTDQLTLAEFITSGRYDRHVRSSRLAYRRRRDRLVATLRREVPAVRVTGIAAGLHAVADLPPGRTEAEVVASAARRGLAVSGLADYRAGPGPRPPALVIGFGTPPAHAFSTAVARLVATLAHSGESAAVLGS